MTTRTMTDDEFVRHVQGLVGATVDGIPGKDTLDRLHARLGVSAPPVSGSQPGSEPPKPVSAAPTGLVRIIWHWTAGTHVVSSTDKEHYHFIIGGDGGCVTGRHSPQANVSTSDGAYAAHTRNCNAGSIGVAVAGMYGATEQPFSAGQYPIRDVQVDALVRLTADLCRKYGIPVTPRTVLSHAEVEPTLGIAQAGKWDVSWLPGMTLPSDPVTVGDTLRRRISIQMLGR